jgi:hypothetical protein
MPLLPSLNDRECQSKLHEKALEWMETPEARAIAAKYATVDEAIASIRSLPQRDDLGDPADGPRIQCDVSQRLRIPALDPNCPERLVMFLGLALLIDPDMVLTSATLMLDEGLHTFPVEICDGFARPVVLDPIAPPLNTMLATVYELRNTSPLAGQNIVPWFTEVARNACIEEGDMECYDIAMAALRRALLTGEPIDQPDELACVMSLVEQDAELFGARGRAAYQRMCRSFRNLSIALDTKRVAKVLNKMASSAQPLASEAIKTALIAKFGPAALIALQGVELAMEDTRTKATELQDEEPKNYDKFDDTTRGARLRRMRRMTFGFRL